MRVYIGPPSVVAARVEEPRQVGRVGGASLLGCWVGPPRGRCSIRGRSRGTTASGGGKRD